MRAILARWNAFQQGKPVLFSFLLGLFLIYAVAMVTRSQIQAFPEFTNVQVQVITQFAGKAAEEVERLVTVPVEVSTNGLPGLINQRSISIFGLSVVTLTFDDAVVARQARIDVNQRLSDAELPDGVKPDLSPDTTPVGEIFRYVLKGDAPTDELRLIEDWTLEREFKSIPGVADVVTYGGPMRTVDVKVDMPRLSAMGLGVDQVAAALGQNHANAGGSLITHGEEGYIVRSIGLYENPQSLESAVIATVKGVPIRVRDIGSVQLGHKPRLGLVGHNADDDVVEGIVYLRSGADSLETCAAIRERIEKLNTTVLPKGVQIQPYYDRTNLIHRSSHTVFHNIIFGVLLVILVLWFGLGGRFWPMTLAVALIIPFSLLMVFVILGWLGFSPNLISLGAVDFGIIIETAIFAAEAVIGTMHTLKKRDHDAVTTTFAEVLAPALLCAGLLIIGFLPILSLQRVEGRIFRPLGVTLIAALIGGQLGTLLFIPIAARFCPVGPGHNRVEEWLDVLIARCANCARRVAALRFPALTVGVILAAVLTGVWLSLGREFLPNLNEGSLYIRATAPSTISMEGSLALTAKIRERLMTIPEVIDVVSQTGRPDDGTDVNGFDNSESFVSLKPPEEWTSASTLDGLVAIAQTKLGDIDGVDFNYSQPIKDNVDEAISGVKGELVIKIYGPKLTELQKIGDQISTLLRQVPGAQDVATEQLMGQPELRFSMRRDLLARYGLRVTDAEEVLETALMGKFAAKLLDDQNRAIDVQVKPALPRAPDAQLLAAMPVLTPDGAKIPLGEVATPSLVEGVGRVYREGGLRRIAVKCSVRGRAVVDFVKDASQRIGDAVKLPERYRMQWSGSFENAERASKQLAIVVPFCVLTMIIILYTWFGSWSMVGFLLWEIPFAMSGGLLLVKAFGLNFSISAAAGAIVLIGVTFLTGMMLISEWARVGDVWVALKDKGRSIILSNVVAIIGLLPAAFSKGMGSETAKPFAVMILGGLTSSLILSLLVLPALISVGSYKPDAR